MIIEIGNTNPIQKDTEGQVLVGKTVTTVLLDDSTTLIEGFKQIADASGGIWVNHSSGSPAWFEGSYQPLVDLLRENYNCAGKPVDWEDTVV